MIALKLLIGWLSWLLVATHLYGFAMWGVDDSSYLILPTAFYQWLDDVFEPTSQDASFDLETWSTEIVAVLALHAVAWGLFYCLDLARRKRGAICGSWKRRIFPVVGWSSWLLVLTCSLIIAFDEALRSRGSKLPYGTVAQVVEVIVGLLIVGSLHVAVLRKSARWRP